jgi:hypothetical protein
VARFRKSSTSFRLARDWLIFDTIMLTPTKTMIRIGTTGEPVLCDAAIICFARTGIPAGASGFLKDAAD